MNTMTKSNILDIDILFAFQLKKNVAKAADMICLALGEGFVTQTICMSKRFKVSFKRHVFKTLPKDVFKNLPK